MEFLGQRVQTYSWQIGFQSFTIYIQPAVCKNSSCSVFSSTLGKLKFYHFCGCVVYITVFSYAFSTGPLRVSTFKQTPVHQEILYHDKPVCLLLIFTIGFLLLFCTRFFSTKKTNKIPTKLVGKQIRFVVMRGGECAGGNQRKVVQTFSYKINKPQDITYKMMTIVYTAIWHIGNVLRVIPKSSHHKDNFFPFLFIVLI